MERFPPLLHAGLADLLAGCSDTGEAIRLRACPGVLCSEVVAADRPALIGALYRGVFQYVDPTTAAQDRAEWWTVRGHARASAWEDADTLRVYFNASASGVEALLRALPPALEHFGLPFVFKALRDGLTLRRDSAVLYLPLRFHALLRALLADVLPTLRPGALRAPTPLFTCAWQPGIAWAVQPADGQSFGVHRCTLLAEAIWAARHAGLDGQRGAEAVAALFRRSGVDPCAPHRPLRRVAHRG